MTKRLVAGGWRYQETVQGMQILLQASAWGRWTALKSYCTSTWICKKNVSWCRFRVINRHLRMINRSLGAASGLAAPLEPSILSRPKPSIHCAVLPTDLLNPLQLLELHATQGVGQLGRPRPRLPQEPPEDLATSRFAGGLEAHACEPFRDRETT